MTTSRPGIAAQKNSIRLEFRSAGVRHRETIKVKPTKAALKDAYRMLEAIKYDIQLGRFDYISYFPYSKNAIKFSKNKGDHITIKQALREWLIRKQPSLAPSTKKDYNNIVFNHLIPTFGLLALTELKPSSVKNWLSQLEISGKRKNNLLIPLRQMYEEAYYDEIIEKNPMERVKALTVHTREPEPFNSDETNRILNQLSGQEQNLILFAFYSGLRSSELIGLQWKDIDLKNQKAFIRRAIVLNKEKLPKTKSGTRTLELLPKAIEALQNQRKYTERENHWVFYDPKHNTRWKNHQAIRRKVWIPALKRANIKYRNPYQTRHTYASRLLSQGEKTLWVAQQMGHSDWSMIVKVYGRWIPV
jgi:integrase